MAEKIREGDRVHLKHTHKNGVAQARCKDGLVHVEDEPRLAPENMLVPIREAVER